MSHNGDANKAFMDRFHLKTMAVSIPHGEDDQEKEPFVTNNNNKERKSLYINAETIRVYTFSLLGSLRERVSLDTIRPLPMFLGFSGAGLCLSADAFTPPVRHIDKSAPEKFQARLKANFSFFLSNYALVAAGVAIVVALMHPGMIFSVALVWSLWWLHSYLVSNELIVFGFILGKLLTITQRSYVLLVVTAVVVVWKCLVPCIVFLSITSFIILLHASTRDPKQVEASGELHPTRDYDSDEVEEVMVERPKQRGDFI